MKLLTEEIKKRLPKLYDSEDVGIRDKVAVCKFFTPWSNWTWWIIEGAPVEGQKEDSDDWVFFALVQGVEAELGYVALEELLELKGPAGLRVERDIHFKPTKLAEIPMIRNDSRCDWFTKETA